MHAEEAHNVRIPIGSEPPVQLAGTVKCACGSNEDSNTAITEFADILRNTEIVNVLEPVR